MNSHQLDHTMDIWCHDWSPIEQTNQRDVYKTWQYSQWLHAHVNTWYHAVPYIDIYIYIYIYIYYIYIRECVCVYWPWSTGYGIRPVVPWLSATDAHTWRPRALGVALSATQRIRPIDRGRDEATCTAFAIFASLTVTGKKGGKTASDKSQAEDKPFVDRSKPPQPTLIFTT